jgi:hypothetical protein
MGETDWGIEDYGSAILLSDRSAEASRKLGPPVALGFRLRRNEQVSTAFGLNVTPDSP